MQCSRFCLNDKIGALVGIVASADVRPTSQSYEVYDKLAGEIDEQINVYKGLLESDVKAFNETLKGQNVKPVTV